MPEDIHWQKYAARFKTIPAQLKSGNAIPGMIVCIPVYAEPDLITTLESLLHCDPPDVQVEVLVLFNQSSRMTKDEVRQHEMIWQKTLEWIQDHSVLREGLSFLPVYITDLPEPKGGVGWARKLGMDEAARRLHPDGVILCLDADCIVEKNYLIAVDDYFRRHEMCKAASIYFEHQLEHLIDKDRHAITQYELHLRYLVHALRWTGHPFAFHTVGSAMAVRRNAYLAQGGMNTRQAGEDFYFLQKFIELGGLHEIKNTTVYPSARISSRVPFGTGRAMQQFAGDMRIWKTTSLQVYSELKPLLENLNLLCGWAKALDEPSFNQKMRIEADISAALATYLASIDFFAKCAEIATHTGSQEAFRKRFFRNFNAFSVIKYAHTMRDLFYPDVPVMEAAASLAKEMKLPVPHQGVIEDYLHVFRGIDKDT